MSDLLSSALELVSIKSVSRGEVALTERVEVELHRHPDLQVARVGDNLVATTSFNRPARVLIAGHLDTVPPSDDSAPRLEGDTLWGLGAVDMKGGLAVMLSLVALVDRASVDVTFVFYACEEIEHDASGLTVLINERPELLASDAAVLMEPTGGLVEAGCQGTLRAVATMTGRRAHTARPQMGVNAVHRLGPLLQLVAGYEPRRVVLDECTYTEQLQAVAVSGGVAGNVVPDLATVTLNHRFAPDRGVAEAEAELHRFLAPVFDEGAGDHLDLKDAAAGAPPALDNPFLSRLVDATGLGPRAKVGWTDVSTFFALGIPAANFGPGDPELAHTPDEHVSADELAHARGVLETLLLGG